MEEITVDIVKKYFPQIVSIQRIRSGGFKTVFSGIINGKKEAIKFIKLFNEDKSSQTMLVRANEEIEVLNVLKCPFIVKIASLPIQEITIGNQNYKVYSEEFLDGEDLDSVIRGRYLPSEQELKDLLYCLIVAIEEFSSQGITNRDIKPDNIIKTNDIKRPFVLLDFGILYRADREKITGTGMTPMTEAFAAPELFDYSKRALIGYKTDLYSAALSVFYFASKKFPFANIQERVLGKMPPQTLLFFRPEISKDFSNLLLGMLKRDPNIRYGNIPQIKRYLRGEI